MDDELDFLEGAMGSWLEPGNADGQHDITAYVVSKSHPGNAAAPRLPPIATRGAAGGVGASKVKSNKVYGYQEPKPMVRPRYKPNANAPQLDRCKDDSGWNARPSNGIPNYDWRSDKHLKKIQDKRDAPPPRKANTAGQPFRRPQAYGMAQHALPKKRASQPTLTRNAVEANNLYRRKPATTGMRTRLPPIKQQPRKPASQPKASPARSAPVHSGRRAPASAPLAETSSPDFFFAKLKAVQNDNELLMVQLAEERQARSLLQLRIATAKDAMAELKDTVARTKDTMKSLEKSVRTSSKREAERTRWQGKLSQKEAQLRDLRKMMSVASKRLKSMETEADRAARKGDTAAAIGDNQTTVRGVDTSYTTQKASIRTLVKQSGDAKKRFEHLSARKKELTVELNGALAANRTKRAAQTQIDKDRDREKAAALKELERRLTQELQQHITRMRDNHHRALRHREREHQQKMQTQRAAMDEMRGRLDNASGHSSTQGKELAELQSQAAEQKKALNDHQSRLGATKGEHEAAVARRDTLQDKVALERDVIGGLEQEALKVEDGPRKQVAPMKANHEKLRTSMQTELSGQQKRQAALLQAVAKLESEMQLFESKYPADGAAALEEELAALDAELQELNGRIDAHNVDQAAAKKDLADARKELAADGEKDKAIEEHTRALAAAERELQVAEQQNTTLLERLDLAERMVSMNGLN